MDDRLRESLSVMQRADRVYDRRTVAMAYDRLAREITDSLGDTNPVVLCVMIGGVVPTAELIRRLDFPLELDYLHATRYRGDLTGGTLVWKVSPDTPLNGRTVLVVDDILDEGHTLSAILDALRKQVPTALHTAVLLEKQHDRRLAGLEPSFVGLDVEDRYVFGGGMDYKGYWRQLPDIYAVSEARPVIGAGDDSNV